MRFCLFASNSNQTQTNSFHKCSIIFLILDLPVIFPFVSLDQNQKTSMSSLGEFRIIPKRFNSIWCLEFGKRFSTLLLLNKHWIMNISDLKPISLCKMGVILPWGREGRKVPFPSFFPSFWDEGEVTMEMNTLTAFTGSIS